MYPRLIPLFGERMFLTEGFQFFIKLLEDLIKRRAVSVQVKNILFRTTFKEKDINFHYCFGWQKYHDFIEIAMETITEYTININGKPLPKWNKSEVDEIVIAQVINSPPP